LERQKKGESKPWVTFKCLSVLLCDPQDLMKNRRPTKISQWVDVGSDVKFNKVTRYK